MIYGAQKLDTCSMDSMDLGPDSNHLGVMITLRMRLQCSVVRAGQSAPEQVCVLCVLSWECRGGGWGRGPSVT